MANENLTHKLTVDELRKGGRKSGEARRAKKSLREAMRFLMDADLTGKDGKTMTGTEAMAAKAFEVIRDTIGEKPIDKVMIADVEPSVIAEVEAMVKSE